MINVSNIKKCNFLCLLLISLFIPKDIYPQDNRTECEKIILEADSLFNKVGYLKKTILLYTQAYYKCGNKEVEFNLSKAQVRLAEAAMKNRDTSVSELCKELKITRATLYKYISPTGELRDYAKRVLEK